MALLLLLFLLLFFGVVVQSTTETPSQHRSTIQACQKKGKQARADRAGIEPGTLRRKPVPPDHETKPPRPPEPPKKPKNRVCASLRSRNAFQHAVNTTRNARGQKSAPQSKRSSTSSKSTARGQKSPTHFVRACAVETHFDIKQESAVNTKRSRTERAPQSGTKAFSLTVRTP